MDLFFIFFFFFVTGFNVGFNKYLTYITTGGSVTLHSLKFQTSTLKLTSPSLDWAGKTTSSALRGLKVSCKWRNFDMIRLRLMTYQ